LALMGLNENVNVFFDDSGTLVDDSYVPAYIRRYPFLLARLKPETRKCRCALIPRAT
jgi:hypothetical protein